MGTTIRLSLAPGGVEANGPSYFPSISADGTHVAFLSDASNLVIGDSNGMRDVFVHEIATGLTERASISTAGIQGDDECFDLAIAGDGRTIAFSSASSNMVTVEVSNAGDIYVRDMQTGTTRVVSQSPTGTKNNGRSYQARISHDGNRIAFTSRGSLLVPNDTNGVPDVFVHNISTGVTTRLSVDSSVAAVQGDGLSDCPAISGDGRWMAYRSEATNLDLAVPDLNGRADVFLHEIATGTTTRISLNLAGGDANGDSFLPAISQGGSVVCFESLASDLALGDTNTTLDLFRYDRLSGATDRISLDSSGAQTGGSSSQPSLTSDGGSVVFTASSPAFSAPGQDWNGANDIYLKNLTTGVVTRVSRR